MKSTTTIQPTDPAKSPVVAAILSLAILGGVGQMYLGQTKKGIILLVATVVGSCVGIGLLIPFVGAYDAYVIGQKLQSGQTVGDMEFFWQAK